MHPSRLASAMDWFWASFSLGIGVMWAYVPSRLVPVIGEYATLWASLPFVAAGTLVCAVLVPAPPEEVDLSKELGGEARRRELLRGVTILVENRQIALSVVIRVLCSLTLYAFPVMMPLYRTTGEIGGAACFSLLEWMTLWAIMNTSGANVVWGRLDDCFGWMRRMRWFGFGGMALAPLVPSTAVPRSRPTTSAPD